MTPSGKRVGTHVVETNARCLIEAVRQIPMPRHIGLEEGTLSEWLYEVLTPHAEKVMVAGVGLTIAHESYVREHVEAGELVTVLKEYCEPFPGFHPYFPRRRNRTAALRALIEYVRRETRGQHELEHWPVRGSKVWSRAFD